MSDRGTNPVKREGRQGEQGFLLVGVIVMVALVLIALSVAAPIVAKDLRREKELEAVHRGQQYTRAIRLYYRKFNSYPSSVKLLEGGAPKERYLRQHYLDPFTGKDDWKLIGVTQVKTTVKGFFGKPIGGLPGAAGGLGAANGLQSGGQSLGNTGGSSTSGAAGGPGPGQTGDTGSGSSAFGTSSFGQGGSTGGSNSPLDGGTSGPFAGVGLPKAGASIITLNEQTDYSTWEFIYDPRIEQQYAKAALNGGGNSTSGGGLGSPPSGFGNTPGNGNGPGNNGPGNNGPGNNGPGNNGPGGNNGQGGNNNPGGGANPSPSAPQ